MNRHIPDRGGGEAVHTEEIECANTLKWKTEWNTVRPEQGVRAGNVGKGSKS